MLKLVFRTFVFLVAAGAVFWVWTLNRLGELRELKPVSAGVCTLVEGAVGAEDITIHHESKTAFVSAFDRRRSNAGDAVRGAIFAYDLEARTVIDVTPAEPAAFAPHGIYLSLEGPDAFLYVVNHGAGESIEIFKIVDFGLRHVETIRDDLMVSLNDVVVLGNRSFYATNDHGTADPLGQFVDDLLNRARANVIYYNGEEASVVAPGLAYANGINKSRFGREIYVASPTRNVVYMFGRDPETGALDEPYEKQMGFGVDNIETDRHGNLWIAGHPKLWSFFRHSKDAGRLSPSQAVWFDTDAEGEYAVRTVYLDLGEEISGASVIAPWGDRLLIGSVFEHFLDCTRG